MLQRPANSSFVFKRYRSQQLGTTLIKIQLLLALPSTYSNLILFLIVKDCPLKVVINRSVQDLVNFKLNIQVGTSQIKIEKTCFSWLRPYTFLHCAYNIKYRLVLCFLQWFLSVKYRTVTKCLMFLFKTTLAYVICL